MKSLLLCLVLVVAMEGNAVGQDVQYHLPPKEVVDVIDACLLYTSDAADE